MSNNNGSEKSRIIKTQDEHGEVFTFELIDIMELDGQEYGLLVYLDEEEEKEGKEAVSLDSEDDEEVEEEEVVVMRLSKNNDNYTFETIENDDEFKKVISYLESESEEN